ncbi:MAG: DUF4136 domain-containing protein [Bacteroidetes bacterium]|nr:MAG: DUF4136 domain-containing protein [Bacteroidota bacterium]
MKAKKHLPAIILGLCLVSGLCVLNGCGIYTEISVTADENTNLSNFKTFAWLPDKMDSNNSPYNNEIIRNNLKNYFGQEMAERGYGVNLDTPDVLLQVTLVNKKQEKEVRYPVYPRPFYYCNYFYCSVYYSPYPYAYYYRHYDNYCYSMGYCKETVQYVEGSITLNVIDRKTNKLVWAGTAKGDIYDPAYINRSIHPAVEAIMKKFPVSPIGNKKKSNKTDDVYMNNSAAK